MRNLLLIYLVFTCYSSSLCAKEQHIEPQDSLLVQYNYDESFIADQYDSLWNALLFQRMPSFELSYALGDEDLPNIPAFPDSVYIERLAALSSAFPLTYNDIVRNFIHVYTDRRKEVTENVLGLQQYYFPIFEEILDQYNLPMELKYLSVIESALNPRAVSRVGATGLWQFMYPTGRMYHLSVNSFIDERRDPVKSTHAAAQYLRDLYAVYGDWHLVIAAYNCGPGNLNRAIRRSGGKRNYWDVYYFLPRETRGYVPSFIAAMYAMNYYKEHNIQPKQCNIPLIVDTLVVTQNIHFEQIAPTLGLPVEVLQALNPQYRRGIVPGAHSPQSIVLPTVMVGRFIALEDSILNNESQGLIRDHELLQNPMAFQNSNRNYAPPANHARLNYTVKSGDNLGFIAQWYDVSVNDLRHWNNIRGNLIRVGQTLHVYVPGSQVSKYRHVNEMTLAQKQGKESFTPPQSTTVAAQGDYLVYTVRQGDTIWKIAQAFPGVSDRDIIRLNKLSGNTTIQPGQVLKIKPNG